MRSVSEIRFILIFIGLLLINVTSYAQNSSEKLKKEQDKLEKKYLLLQDCYLDFKLYLQFSGQYQYWHYE